MGGGPVGINRDTELSIGLRRLKFHSNHFYGGRDALVRLPDGLSSGLGWSGAVVRCRLPLATRKGA